MKSKITGLTLELSPKETAWLRAILNYTAGDNPIMSAAEHLEIPYEDLHSFVHQLMGELIIPAKS